MKRWYIGQKNGKREAFASEVVPTKQTHGHLYNAVTGPFRTKRAAVWGCQYGTYWDTIADAERAAKKDTA